MLGKKSKHIFFIVGLFFFCLLAFGKGIINVSEKLTSLIFSEKNSFAISDNKAFEQFEFSKFSAIEDNLDLSSVSIDLISFNSSLMYFPGGSISVLFEPKGILPLDNVFKLELSQNLKCDGLVVVNQKTANKINSFNIYRTLGRLMIINSNKINKTLVYFTRLAMCSFKTKLINNVG